jgi:hypothetical protein
LTDGFLQKRSKFVKNNFQSMSSSIVQIGNSEKLLSKSQKEFNRLIKKIEKTEQELVEYRNAATRLQERVQKDLSPLRRQYAEQIAQLVRTMDRAYDNPFFKNAERKKIAKWILKNAFSLIDDFGMDDLKPIYDKYDEDGFDETNNQTNEQIGESMKAMLSRLFGIEVEDDVDVSSPELMQAYLNEKLSEKNAEFQQQNQQRKKSKKQIEKEEKRTIETKNITKAVRTIYMDLVKAFHPDRETDEAEKIRKTEIMHRITEAYEKNDLLALFKLQLEFNRIDKDHLDSVAEDLLKYYNKILKQQVSELEQELEQLQAELQAMTGRHSYYISTPTQIEMQLTTDINALKRDIKDIKKEAKQLQDNDILRLWLKNIRVQKANKDDSFDDIFGTMF